MKPSLRDQTSFGKSQEGKRDIIKKKSEAVTGFAFL
jgi:hypothetical protein